MERGVDEFKKKRIGAVELMLPGNATICEDDNKYVIFRDSCGKDTRVLREELDKENMEIFSIPSALNILNTSIDDYLDGRFTDFTP